MTSDAAGPPNGSSTSPDASARQGYDETSRKRRTTRHLLLSLAAVVIFGGAITVLAISDQEGAPPNPGRGSSTSASPSPSPTLGWVQPTILIQASGDAGSAVNLLTALSVEADPKAIMITLAPDLMVSAPGVDSESIRTTVSSIDTLRAPSAVSATLGVRIDGSWRLDRKALSGLVDAGGGLSVTLTEAVRVRDGSGEVALNLKTGVNSLTGAQAAWYAVGKINGESPVDQTERALVVFSDSLAALPNSVTAIRETLTSLGALAPTTIGAQALAEYLVEYRNAMNSGRRETFPIPTTSVALGPTQYEWVDFNRATPKLRKTLPLALWNTSDGSPPRVLVTNGTERPGLIGSTRISIENLGYIFVDGRGTKAETDAKSAIAVRGEEPWGLDVAKSLDLRAKSVSNAPNGLPPEGRRWAYVDVQLQENYEP
jgi:anionic cell wall polymer biosynthesis LytR-Cps2A-Psr (LCP) family protein